MRTLIVFLFCLNLSVIFLYQKKVRKNKRKKEGKHTHYNIYKCMCEENKKKIKNNNIVYSNNNNYNNVMK